MVEPTSRMIQGAAHRGGPCTSDLVATLGAVLTGGPCSGGARLPVLQHAQRRASENDLVAPPNATMQASRGPSLEIWPLPVPGLLLLSKHSSQHQLQIDLFVNVVGHRRPLRYSSHQR